MDFGIGIATSFDSWQVARRAEELGFSHVWFFDTQMITADCFVAMGAAALKTSRIRLGTGVLVPSNRIAAVTANAFATLNGMAPGRIDFGVGTGFSARRAMGLGGMKLADLEEYIRVVYGLLRGETLETDVEGKQRKIRLLNPDAGLINTTDPIKLHVSAYGPKSQALTARLGAAWKSFVSDVPNALAELEGMKKRWAEAGRADEPLYATAWTCGCVLEPGETLDSPRVLAQAGPRAAVLLHRAADVDMQGWANTSDVPELGPRGSGGLRPDGARLRARGRAIPAEPSRALRVRQTGGAALRHPGADPSHHLHRERTGAEAARRGDARRGVVADRVLHHSGRGARARGFRADPEGVRLIAFRSAGGFVFTG